MEKKKVNADAMVQGDLGFEGKRMGEEKSKMAPLIPASGGRIRSYSGTWGVLIFLLIYIYVAWPIEVFSPTNSELQEVDGMPVFRTAATFQSTDTYFLVNGVRLNCSYDAFGGSNGCELFSASVDVKMPVRATYFWMRTRWWYSYRELHTLEQGGRLIISPHQSNEMRLQSSRTGWKVYFQLLILLVVTTIVVWFLENNIKEQ